MPVHCKCLPGLTILVIELLTLIYFFLRNEASFLRIIDVVVDVTRGVVIASLA